MRYAMICPVNGSVSFHIRRLAGSAHGVGHDVRDALPLARREDARLPAFGFQPAGVVERQARVVADFRPGAASERVLVRPPRPLAGEIDLRERRRRDRDGHEKEDRSEAAVAFQVCMTANASAI